ncbi:mRNA interferase YafQ [Furfurilactobacillus rossiae]|uniref:type II toxin-antitoxin system RelE/ParE family toxin n=1 Tax=Furfurilactobacillus rossiae TaxID=231049 RepID=UPI0015BCF51D|nr:type II toxin-antitoxin system mRNA interferase toxin, RelE/StbE family [Furfurilactobacillus rossiae]MCF6166653.1 type II toxin-antitoxin system YafQ family toxin [Furfurilactobacillus rossiae]QLE63303.1 mRNA interferase YafQ [Furfurilactobacillus rossiae]
MIEFVQTTPPLRRNLKRLARQHYPVKHVSQVVDLIVANDIETLKRQYLYHSLCGDLAGVFDVHLSQNWLLLFTISEDGKTLFLINTGDHSIIGK